MENCPYCNTEIVDDLSFCVECERQIRCLACGRLLFKNKKKCLHCGTLLTGESSLSANANSYTLEEKTTKSSTYRRIEVVASDSAVGAFLARLPIGAVAPLSTVDRTDEAVQNDKLLVNLEQPDASVIDYGSEGDSGKPTDTSDDLKALFSDHSQFGIIPSKTLRDYIQSKSTKKDQQQIFVLLYVWAFNNHARESITRHALMAVLKYEGLYDSNTRVHINKVINDYFVVNDNTYRINEYDGRKRIKQILDEIKNPKPDTETIEAKRKKKAGRPIGASNKTELETISPWIDMETDLPDHFDVRRLNSATDWALLAIYILTKLLKVEVTVKPGIAYVFISKKYPTLPITRNNFRDTLGRDKVNVQKSVVGAYSLTEQGEAKIRQLIEKVEI